MKKLAIHAALASMFFVGSVHAVTAKKGVGAKVPKTERVQQKSGLKTGLNSGAVNSESTATKLPKKENVGTTIPAAESVGTSTVVIPKDETKSPFGATLIVKSNTALKDTRASEVEGFVGASYKLNKSNSIGFRHYFSGAFETSQVATEETGSHLALRNSIDSLTYTYGSEAGLLGSQPVVSTFFFNMPGNEVNLINKKYRFGLRYDAQPTWQLTPKVAVSYFFSPRYSHFVEEDLNGNPNKDTLKVVHFAEMDYSLTDNIVFYGTAGYTNIFQTQNMVYTDETAMLAAGVNFVMAKGKFILNPEIDKEVSVVKGQARQASANLFTPDDLTLVLSGAMTF